MKNDVINNYCKRCGASLVDILTVDKNVDLDISIVIHCGHCGEVGDPKCFHGLIQFASTQETDIVDLVINEEDNTMEFYTSVRKEIY